jgi:hypothetical protein
MEKDQQWSGIIVDITNDELHQLSRLFTVAEEPYWYYNVPFKSGTREALALNIINSPVLRVLKKVRLSIKDHLLWLESELGVHSGTEQADIRSKLENTIRYLNDCIQRYSYAESVGKVLGNGELPEIT